MNTDDINEFLKGCVIRDIKKGSGNRDKYIYASLYGPDGKIIISATLEYITKELMMRFVDKIY